MSENVHPLKPTEITTAWNEKRVSSMLPHAQHSFLERQAIRDMARFFFDKGQEHAMKQAR